MVRDTVIFSGFFYLLYVGLRVKRDLFALVSSYVFFLRIDGNFIYFLWYFIDLFSLNRVTYFRFVGFNLRLFYFIDVNFVYLYFDFFLFRFYVTLVRGVYGLFLYDF